MEHTLKSVNQILIEPSQGWFDLNLRAVWQYRELLYFLVWRDVKVRYKQTVLGIAWVVLQPLITMLVFSGLFGVLLQVPTGDIPYPIFVLSGLLPWQYFSGALNRSATSLVDNTNLVTKVYFPRLVIPLAAALSGLVDFGVSFVILLLIMLAYRIHFSLALLVLPIFVLLPRCIASTLRQK